MTKWDFEKARKAALQCEWRSHFDREYAGASLWAKRNGCYDDVVAGLKSFKTWNEKSVREAASQCNTTLEMQRRFSGARKWAERNGIWKEIQEGFDKKFFWDFDLVKQESLKYGSRNEFHEGNPSAAQWATRNNFMDALFPSKLKTWDLESCTEEALKYQSREEFRKKAAGAACWAVRNGLWDVICSHMDVLKKPVTKQECISEALKYKTRSEFYEKCPRCYAWALRNKGMMEEVCSHMEKGENTSDKNVVYLWSPEGYDSVFKVGHTSKRVGEKRILAVCNAGGFSPSFTVMRYANNAQDVEGQLLSLGKPYSFGREFTGHTEFRVFSPQDVQKAFEILEPYEDVA